MGPLCGIKDSNFHSSRNQILSLARLPIPPMPRRERSERPKLFSKAGAKVRRNFELCKKIRKLFIIFCQMA